MHQPIALSPYFARVRRGDSPVMSLARRVRAWLAALPTAAALLVSPAAMADPVHFYRVLMNVESVFHSADSPCQPGNLALLTFGCDIQVGDVFGGVFGVEQDLAHAPDGKYGVPFAMLFLRVGLIDVGGESPFCGLFIEGPHCQKPYSFISNLGLPGWDGFAPGTGFEVTGGDIHLAGLIPFQAGWGLDFDSGAQGNHWEAYYGGATQSVRGTYRVQEITEPGTLWLSALALLWPGIAAGRASSQCRRLARYCAGAGSASPTGQQR